MSRLSELREFIDNAVEGEMLDLTKDAVIELWDEILNKVANASNSHNKERTQEEIRQEDYNARIGETASNNTTSEDAISYGPV